MGPEKVEFPLGRLILSTRIPVPRKDTLPQFTWKKRMGGTLATTLPLPPGQDSVYWVYPAHVCWVCSDVGGIGRQLCMESSQVPALGWESLPSVIAPSV